MVHTKSVFLFLTSPIGNLIDTEFERMSESLLPRGDISQKPGLKAGRAPANEFTYVLEHMFLLDPARGDL